VPEIVRDRATESHGEPQRSSLALSGSLSGSLWLSLALVVPEFQYFNQPCLVSNLSFIMNDPEHIRDPHIFDPTRF